MKKYFVYLLFLLACTGRILSQFDEFPKLEFHRVSANFNGISYNSGTILVFGDGGIILRSSDLGGTWSQINLDESYNISGMCNIGNKFFGVIGDSYAISSLDNGLTWNVIELDQAIKPKKILPYTTNLFCLSNNLILKYDQDFKLIKEYKLETDTSIVDFTICGDNIYYSAGNGKLGIIDLLTNNQKTVDFSAFGICVNCPAASGFFSSKLFPYFNIGMNLYRYNPSNSIIELVHNGIKKAPYCAHNDDVYQIYSIYNETYNLDSLYYFKVEFNTKTSTNIKLPGNDRYISQLRFTNIEYLDDNNIIAVGRDKLIYMSSNGGLEWTLKSHFNVSTSYGNFFRFDDQNSSRIGPYVKFERTTNGGSTWLSQKNYSNEYRYSDFADYSNFGSTFFSDKNNGYIFISINISGRSNFAYTNDGGENVILKDNSKLKYAQAPKKFSLKNKNNNLLIIPGHFLDKYYYTIISRLDNEMNEIVRTVLDSLNFLFIDTFENGKMYAVVINYREREEIDKIVKYNKIYYTLLSSLDAGLTWQEESILSNVTDLELYLPNGKKSGDNIVFYNVSTQQDSSYLGTIYRLNLKNKTIDSLYSQTDLSVNNVSRIGSKTLVNTIYYLTDGIKMELLSNDDLEANPYDWKNITPRQRYSTFYFKAFNDSLFVISSYDSLIKSDVVWFAKQQIPLGVDDEFINYNQSDFSISPNPSSDFIEISVGANGRSPLQNDVRIYDVYGQTVLSVAAIHELPLRVEVSSLAPGMYFVRIGDKVGKFVKL